MKTSMMNLPDVCPSPALLAAIADAGAAADRAASLAAETGRWTRSLPRAADDAGDAARAAMRARLAAEQARNASSVSGAWSLARLAWAAETSAEEACSRVTSIIADQLLM